MWLWITENWETIFGIITGVISVASAISALTPNTTDDTIVAKAKKVVDVLALNVANAKNKSDEAEK